MNAPVIPRQPGLKDRLWAELALKARLNTDGVSISPEALAHIAPGIKTQEQVHTLFEMDFVVHEDEQPSYFRLDHGLVVPFRYNPEARDRIELDGTRTVVVRDGHQLAEAFFPDRPAFYGKKTSDGVAMSTIATLGSERQFFVAYSNECSYKAKGEDCLFCNINFTKDTYGEKTGIFWKTAKQIGETYAEAHRAGLVDHVNITGGVIPERRELEYYLDVADALRKYAGVEDFNGTAVVAAPIDLRNLDRFKEAGYRTVGLNLEFWDKGIYNAICPGKARDSGGWDHWLKAIEYSVGVFGHGNVRSNFVGGIEPKKSLLAGIQYLADKGAVGTASIWCPNPGSDLEGHRAPEPEWYLDLGHKIAAIWQKAGFTWANLYDSNADVTSLQHDIWRIEAETLPIFKGAAVAAE
ncbi:radical SAM protein [Rhodobacter capsulatus]|uniref:radical SAM protein n=1 Tax=Rhodobacter capsulatus TaxID=1061 RepID=UPI00402806BA